MTGNNPNLDIANMNAYINFGEIISMCSQDIHTGQCKRTGGCYSELVVAFFSTGGGVKGEEIYTC